jgi:hypothetical protein
MTPLFISPSDLHPAALANRCHELRRMRLPDRPSLALDRHRIVMRRYLPDDDGGSTPPACPAIALSSRGI